EGEYGGGTVMVWDRGDWKPEANDVAKALRAGKLSFDLAGERLKGKWTLTRMGRRDEDKENWLLIKRSGKGAGKSRDPLKWHADSVKSGRAMEEIAADRDAVWKSNSESSGAAKSSRAASQRAAGKHKRKSSAKTSGQVDPAKIKGAKKAALPRTLKPQLATLVSSPPAGDGWIHEIKFDGYRLLCRRDGEKVTLLTRTGKDWTKKFPPIAEAIAALPVQSAVIDGEATIVDAHGRTSFQQLQGALKEQKFERLAFFAFDLPYLSGYDLTGAPLEERKKLLQQIVPNSDAGVLRYSDHVVGEGESFHAHACKLGLEGVIAKQLDSPYRQQRTRTWLKIKCQRRQEFVVIGWTPPGGSRKHFGSLLLAAHDDAGHLVYTGRVGTGFNDETLASIGHRLRKLERKTPPTDEAPPRADARQARWVTPQLVAEVEFTEWTSDGRLRHPSFQGLRADKEAADVKIEQPAEVENTQKPGNRKGKSAKSGGPSAKGAVVAGVSLSHPQRVLYPEQGLTKLDLATYYADIAEQILPFVEGRPLSTVRCPQGREKKCFFQKHVGETLQAPVRAIRVKEKSGTADYIGVDGADGLVTLIQFGVLEIHPWGAKEDALDKPDVITFDLDPGDGVTFGKIQSAAERLRDVLAEVDLESFVKTSGGKGLHVVVPLARRANWADVKDFAAAVARRMAREEPEQYLATMSKAKRKGRIFVDYLRNSRGATSVAPWSTRARPGAPVSMPLAWSDLKKLKNADAYTVENARQHLRARSRDPWADYFRTRQQVTASRLKAMEPAPGTRKRS
ncbi:MAG: DNA ligase D, partial [Phycisphaerales bacterium]|nr:DNA ligase D [Phycisphaerales bacterium]